MIGRFFGVEKRLGWVVFVMMVVLSVTACAGTPVPVQEALPTAVATASQPEESEAGETPASIPEEIDTDSPASRNNMYSAAPEMQIDPSKYYAATIETEKGDMVVSLFADKAPLAVNNFVFLAREGFYDNTTFHRVIPGFMAQGGDPTGTGMGGPGYTFPDEFDPQLSHDRVGTLSMANSGPSTNGSQFFITFGPTTWLDDMHTVFGRVVSGLDVLNTLSPRDPEAATTPGDLIKSIRIIEQETPIASEVPAAVDIPMPEQPTQRNALYPQPPAMTIDPEKRYEATFVTSKGEIVVALDAGAAPVTVNNFVFLARQGFYDGLTFHRVEPEFVIQGGDPLGSGQGGAGYVIPAEIGLSHVKGAIAMARLADQANPRRMSSGSQFYITLDETSMLDGGYTVFGKVTEGMEVVESIAVGDVIEAVTILEE